WGNFTPDGQSIIFQRGLTNKVLTLWRFELADNKLTQLTQTLAAHPAVSPDSAKTAYYFLDKIGGKWKIGLISTITGEFLGNINLPENATDRTMRWFPNGKFISQIAYQGDETKLLLLPLNENEIIQSFDLGKGNVQWLDWSKDGKNFVIAQEIQTQDVVLISN
nr:hypothetical protein [Pyrinomonadaceae bacterium]